MSDKAQEKQEKAQEQQEQLKKRLSRIKNIIMVMSGKGGVGKSTVSANLSLGLAKEGYKVGVLDADIHGPNMPKILGSEANKLQADADGNIVPIEAHSNLSLVSVGYLLDSRDTPVIWRGPMKHTAISQFIKDVNWGDLDFLVVDLPPGTGDEPLSIAQLIKGVEGIDAPYAVVVTTPQDVALLDSRKSVEFARALELRFLGVIENMSGFVCPHCGERIDLFKVGGGKKAAEEMKVPFLGAIPIDTGIVKDTDDGVPFMSRNDNSAANTAFSGIIKNILDTI